MNITEFLEARIAEDEEVARELLTHQPGGPWMDSHFVRWNPDRVLAECAAKRAILALDPVDPGVVRIGDWTSCSDWCAPVVAEHAILALAAVYADHPDYRQEWAL